MDSEQATALVGQEVEVTVLETSLLIEEVLIQRKTRIDAKQVDAVRVRYDLRDYTERVQALEKAWQSENRKRRKAEARLSSAANVIDELKRRAAIKSDASEAHRKMQAAAFRVLERLEVELSRKQD